MVIVNGIPSYTVAEAIEVLSISEATLNRWVKDAKLRKQMDKQRMPDDMRSHYLTKEQVEQLAQSHRREIVTKETPDPLTSNLNEIFRQLKDLDERVKALEDVRPSEDDLPI